MSRTTTAVGLGLVVVLALTLAVWRANELRQDQVQAQTTRQNLREIRAAEVSFKNRHARFGTLSELIEAGLLVTTIKDQSQADYRIVVPPQGNTYTALVTPKNRDDTQAFVGLSFYLDESGVIRWAAFGKMGGYRLPTKTDPPIPEQ